MNIKWREILIYSFLAYLFSWTYWLTALLGKNPAHPFKLATWLRSIYWYVWTYVGCRDNAQIYQ